MIYQFYGSEPHYIDHMMPICNTMRDRNHNTTIGAHGKLVSRADPVIVAAYKDLVAVRDNGCKNIVYMEHGAGQRYNGLNPSGANYYCGGERRGVKLLFVPGSLCSARYLQKNCSIPKLVIGCPKLQDIWLTYMNYVPGQILRVGLNFHWDCKLCSETEATWHQWLPTIRKLQRTRSDIKFYAFVHPRSTIDLLNRYKEMGIEIVPTCFPVDVLLCDNSSLGFELAYCGVYTIWLNGLQYRPGINHGLRFSILCEPQVSLTVNSDREALKEINSHIDKKRNKPGMTSMRMLLPEIYGVDPFTGNIIACNALEALDTREKVGV